MRFAVTLVLLTFWSLGVSGFAQVVTGNVTTSSAGLFDDQQAKNEAQLYKEKNLTPNQRAEVDRLENEARMLERSGQTDRAIERHSQVININPGDFDAMARRGSLWLLKKEWAKAKADFVASQELHPKAFTLVESANNFAWLLATCPDDSIRDGKLAVELAEKVYSRSPGIATADTLAAAYAESGDFAKAVETQKKVLALAQRIGDPEAVFAARLAEYETGKPHRVD